MREEDSGRRLYRIYGAGARHARTSDGTDLNAVAAGRIAVTPLHFDLTDEPGIDTLGSYDLARLLAPAARGGRVVAADAAARAQELREQLRYHNERYYVHDDPEIGDDAYDALLDELRGIEREHPDLLTPDSPTQVVGGRAGSSPAREGHPPAADVLAGQRPQRGGAARVGRADAQPPRARGHRGPRVRLRRRAEDRRPGDVAGLPRRRARAGGHARQRRGRRGRHAQPPHDRDRAAATSEDAPPLVEVRGEVYMAPGGLPARSTSAARSRGCRPS